MGLIETFKSSAIQLVDQVNKLSDPFDDFTRPAFYPAASLSALEVEFYRDLTENFWGCDGQVLLHRIPMPPGSALDMGDQAIWHGIYTATLALRYHLSSDSEQKDVYSHLVDAAKGLQLHQRAHGEGTARLIRGVSDDQKKWQDDASNDSATGHLFGIYALWKWGPTSLRPVCEQLALGLAAELLGHAHALVNADGKPTTYGALEQGWKSDPLRITLALAIYAVGAILTRQPAFMKAYSDLYGRYKAIVPYPKARLWLDVFGKQVVMDNNNDTHRAAIHLAILADLTNGEAMHRYLSGLQRLRGMVEKHGNVWVNALCAWQCGSTNYRLSANRDREIALKVLSEFTLKDKQYNNGRDNYALYLKAPGTFPSWKFQPVKWKGTWMANQPLPRHAVVPQDFFWQRNLMSLDVGSDGAQADSRLNGGDYLAAYWMSRLSGTLSEAD